LLTDLSFLNPGEPWPPVSEISRLQKYEENKKLFKGKHDEIFKDWIRILREEQNASLLLIFNWHKRLSTLWGDLLLSEEPRFSAGQYGSREDEELRRIIEKSDLINTAYQVVLDISRYGTGLFNIRNGKIDLTTPSIWFPVVSPDNIKEEQYHVLAWKVKRGEDEILKAQIHERGKYIANEYLLAGEKIERLLSTEEVSTGLSDFAIIPVHNTVESDEYFGIDDYTDIDGIIQELEVRVSQISRVLDKHSDPNMYGDESALELDPATGVEIFRGGGKYFPVPLGGTPPGYVVWDAKLESNWKEIEILMQQLYIISETSEACFGQLKQGMVESGSALKRLMITPLAKAQRLRMRLDPALKKAIKLCSQTGEVNLTEKPINIAWQDGIPSDDKEQAEVMAIRTGSTGGARTLSVRTAIKRMDNMSDAEVESEMERIAEDLAAENALDTGGFGAGDDDDDDGDGGDE
jgi:hypothetical protein